MLKSQMSNSSMTGAGGVPQSPGGNVFNVYYGSTSFRGGDLSPIAGSMASLVSTPSMTPSLDHSNLIQFNLQVGLHREQVTAYKGDLNITSLKELALIVLQKQFPQAQVLPEISSKINLFRHDACGPNLLNLIRSPEEVSDGSLIEIVLSADVTDNSLLIIPHQLFVHSYKSPTFCDFCGEMLWGIVRQGLKCEGCRQNYHKRCAYKIPNNCTLDPRRARKPSVTPSLSIVSNLSNGLGGSDDNISITDSQAPITTKSSKKYNCRPIWQENQAKIKVPHNFESHSYTRPTVCQHCRRLLRGLVRQGVKCKDCKFNCHKKCAPNVPVNCPGEDEFSRRDSDEYNPTNTMETEDSINTIPEEDDNEVISPTTPGPSLVSTAVDEVTEVFVEMEVDQSTDTSSNSNLEPSGPNIPLMRVVQSIKQTKKRSSTVLKEGWLVHFTNRDEMRKRHFWRVDTKSITLYQEETGTKYYKEIPLSEVLTIMPAESNLEPGFPPYAFKILTSGLELFVRDDATISNNDIMEWHDIIRKALMPVASDNRPAIVNTKEGGGAGVKRKISVMVSLNRDQPEDEKVTDISQIYQIFPDEVLGSGQFGVVYGGKHRKRGFDVAIKVIDKQRFPQKEDSQLRHEVQILEALNQPGIVKLYNMFETPEQVFVVMEKLRGDMLEMILSSVQGRLPERITKFLIWQTLIALKYLHMKNIVHCDLKPENVLLSSDDPYPQVKLCDFGFARIIGEKQFRRSVVGTPAYLAPEVLSKQCYNRSLDMWSVGVIVYVSLSGTFPFNEDEDINQQIQNADFMYPPNPWKDISKSAIELIMSLLQVKKRKRPSVNQALNQLWLQDYQTWCDLRQLESLVGQRYLTHESDDERWENYRKENNIT